MTKLLEDQTVATINRMVYLNNCQVLNHVLRSSDVAHSLVELLYSEDVKEKLHAISFLNELCGMSRSMKLEAESWFFG